ncbi:MAG: TlpA family protein disulfide reductase [Oscillospiraceae bacterium]|nr:TlpA family protein disulfide reductase [Oscillospiraceae bacterium]
MKKLLSVVLLVVLLTTALNVTAYADTGLGIEPGDNMPDFTVPLTDGTTATLSELLQEKDLVVLNVFASWCGPCKREFPEMETVYQANKDRMEIVAVSGEPEDTQEIIAAYKVENGLSFPMGLIGDELGFLKFSAFPTTLMIDRNGMVGLAKVGAFASREEFEGYVNYFLSEDYSGKAVGFQKALNITPIAIGALLAGGLLLVVGRWGILRKAGKKGWHSLIPLLNVYDEYSTVWNGWLGVLADLCIPVGLLCNALGLPSTVYHVLIAASILIGVPEGIKLARAFGKGKVLGVLLAVPVIKEIGRLVLGLSKLKFQPAEA